MNIGIDRFQKTKKKNIFFFFFGLSFHILLEWIDIAIKIKLFMFRTFDEINHR